MRLRREREDAGPEWAPSERREPSTFRRVTLPLGLFGLTLYSTSLAGGAAFSLTLMSILVAHEMGHYLVARYHGVEASLPHFIPLPPIFPLGTLGAVIGMRTDQATRNQLMDIGAAGPIAGFLVAVPAMVIGIQHSDLLPLQRTFLENHFMPSMLVTFSSLILPTSEGPLMFFGDSLLSAGLVRLLRPDVREGWDLAVGPVFFGAWAGFLVTAINLLPMGQLDGGHILHAWNPQTSERHGRLVHRILKGVGGVGVVVHGPSLVFGLVGGVGQVAGALGRGASWLGVHGPRFLSSLMETIAAVGESVRVVFEGVAYAFISAVPHEFFVLTRPLYPWFSFAFLVWAFFGKLTGLRHPAVLEEGTALTPLRRATAIACGVITLVAFMPNPQWLDGVWLL
ncbi:MAG: site-2 protease family protein [Deltaproteobacteria bacterium]|nr:site-2 protease family protein [Deltaproteobacteria bacterium]